MTISAKTWNDYVTRLSQLNRKAGQLMQQYMDTHGTEDADALIRYAYALVTKYGEGSAELAAQMYDAIAAAEEVFVPTAEPADTASYGEVARMVNGTRTSPPQLQSGVSRLVKRAGADTTLKNARRDGAQWAWVPHGDTCPFCITLASRGWQTASAKTLKGDHAEHIHSNCDCEFAVRFNSGTNVAGYDPEKYLKQYRDAGSDVNAMRRIDYAARKDAINAQKRAAYAARKLDFMGAPKDFSDSNGIVSIKAYQVKGHNTIFTQTNTQDAQRTIQLISDTSAEIKQLQTVPEIVVAKDIPGIAAYDHVDNRLYVNERISNADFIKEQLSDGYFVAENAKDILKHEMHHKDHWDYISAKALTTGKSNDIVKQEIEADLREYVQNQITSDPKYVRNTVSGNAALNLQRYNSLNELIADVLLQADKQTGKDPELLKLVGDMLHDD
jgi:hypothetical protein